MRACCVPKSQVGTLTCWGSWASQWRPAPTEPWSWAWGGRRPSSRYQQTSHPEPSTGLGASVGQNGLVRPPTHTHARHAHSTHGGAWGALHMDSEWGQKNGQHPSRRKQQKEDKNGAKHPPQTTGKNETTVKLTWRSKRHSVGGSDVGKIHSCRHRKKRKTCERKRRWDPTKCWWWLESKGTLIFRMRQCERLGREDGGGWEEVGAGAVGARKDSGNVQGRLHPK